MRVALLFTPTNRTSNLLTELTFGLTLPTGSEIFY